MTQIKAIYTLRKFETIHINIIYVKHSNNSVKLNSYLFTYKPNRQQVNYIASTSKEPAKKHNKIQIKTVLI
jgi:hypothetical protein